MSIEQALADLAAATSSDVLGRPVEIDGKTIDCVKRNLEQEEAMAFAEGRFAGDGLLIEGFRISVDRNLLAYQPVVGGRMEVDGHSYDVRQVQTSGDLLRITLTRYLS
jgi:hypothetical protein